MWIEKLAFITTVGELHEGVQSLGELAWFEFQRAYHEAAGLKPKRKQNPVCASVGDSQYGCSARMPHRSQHYLPLRTRSRKDYTGR
jgi:hypothetical protein